ncbi:MAG: hypothetical protein H6712_08005 [Myxococcales bacterium]|nr:hypothetical protein [Myxococcales bacterium]MCB9713781.1 hypothetical protein [Myxococcales bacterium]
MAEPGDIEVVVEALHRSLLDGIGSDEPGTIDLAVLPYFEDERPLQGLAGLVDWRTSGRLSSLIREGFCTGRAGEAVLMPGRRTLPMRRLVLLGLGPSSSFDRSTAEATGERLVALVQELRADEAIVAMPGRVADRAVVEAVFDGLTRALLGPSVEAAARPKAVGDEEVGPVMVGPSGDASRGGSVDAAAPEERAPLEVAREPEFDPGEGQSGPFDEGDDPPPATPLAEPATPPEPPEPARRRIRVVADPRHEARLRRLLEGPPRAADPGS